jgi:GT2 family glycosyltransferase
MPLGHGGQPPLAKGDRPTMASMSGAWPQVSVVLPVYNGAATVGESIASILSQESVQLELIVVDDASTDQSRDIVRSFDDSRIVHVELGKNRGLAGALNEGIAVARAAFVARQDQDDVSHPERLHRQLDFLSAHPEVVLLGSWADILEPDAGSWTTVGKHRHPIVDDEIRLRLLWNNPFVHSSVVFRRSAFDLAGRYRLDRYENYPEDYDLWSRMASQGRLANLPAFLVAYRESPAGMSRTTVSRLNSGVIRIAARNMADAMTDPVDPDDLLFLAARLNSLEPAMHGRLNGRELALLFWKITRGPHRLRLRLLKIRLRWALKLLLNLRALERVSRLTPEKGAVE